MQLKQRRVGCAQGSALAGKTFTSKRGPCIAAWWHAYQLTQSTPYLQMLNCQNNGMACRRG
jgi:hypothetical protein